MTDFVHNQRGATLSRTKAIPSNVTVRDAPRGRGCHCGSGHATSISKDQCEECRRASLTLQHFPSSSTALSDAPPIVHHVLRSPGKPLDPEIQATMESRLGHNFSRVRVHSDARAAESARTVGAFAYTAGTDIVFASGRYAPKTPIGAELLSHELTHTVQQSRLTGPIASGADAARLETEANTAAARVARGSAMPRASGLDRRPVARQLAASMIQRQPDPKIGAVDDPLEHEADRVADRLLSMPSPKVSAGTPTPRSRRDSYAGEEAGLSADSGEADAIVHEALRSFGQPLDPATRAFMEPRFGHDFSQVRVHSGAAAELSAQGLNANAFTVGRNIIFGAGQFSPGTPEGRRLLAHELVHVAQRSSAVAIQRDARKDAEGHPARELRSAGAGFKVLSKGVLNWQMSYEGKGVSVQIIFTPYKPYPGKTITFLQSLLRTKTSDADPTKRPRVDLLTFSWEDAQIDQFVPFYGAEWDNATGTWVPERKSAPAGLPAGSRSQPSSATDPSAYLYDEPVAYNEQLKLFESVVVVPETGETLGAIRWGVKGTPDGMELLVPDVGKGDVSDAPTAGFLVVMDRFYAQPPTVGPEPTREERYDAIVDGFMANDGMAAAFVRGIVFSPLQKASFLNADQENKIDPIITKLKSNPTLVVELGGFADATEKDPRATSEARALAAERYLVGQGVPKASIVIAGFFGAAWTLVPPSPTASRNRRVQLRVHREKP